jgi:hypothetical protein
MPKVNRLFAKYGLGAGSIPERAESALVPAEGEVDVGDVGDIARPTGQDRGVGDTPAEPSPSTT